MLNFNKQINVIKYKPTYINLILIYLKKDLNSFYFKFHREQLKIKNKLY